MLLSKYVVRNSKMSRFINKREASGLLNKLRIKTSLSEIPLLEDIFYWYNNDFTNYHNNLLITKMI